MIKHYVLKNAVYVIIIALLQASQATPFYFKDMKRVIDIGLHNNNVRSLRKNKDFTLANSGGTSKNQMLLPKFLIS